MLLLTVTWAVCWMRQLAGCYLVVWLAFIVNAGMGAVSWLYTGFNWLAHAAQTGIDFAGSAYIAVTQNGVSLWAIFRIGLVATLRELASWFLNNSLVQMVWGWLDGLVYLRLFVTITLTAISNIFWNVYDAAVKIGGLTTYMIAAVVGSITASPYDIVIGGQETIPPDQLFADGPNVTKVLWIALVSLFVIDDVVGRYDMQVLLLLPVMAMAFTAAIWTVAYWRKILPN
jgi:hypothetical protein